MCYDSQSMEFPHLMSTAVIHNNTPNAFISVHNETILLSFIFRSVCMFLYGRILQNQKQQMMYSQIFLDVFWHILCRFLSIGFWIKSCFFQIEEGGGLVPQTLILAVHYTAFRASSFLFFVCSSQNTDAYTGGLKCVVRCNANMSRKLHSRVFFFFFLLFFGTWIDWGKRNSFLLQLNDLSTRKTMSRRRWETYAIIFCYSEQICSVVDVTLFQQLS